MRLHRTSSRWLSGWLVLTLLFMQLATAAYACPVLAPPQEATMQAMPACEGHASNAVDPSPTTLCKAHCQQGSQADAAAPSLDAATSFSLVAVLDWTQPLLLSAGHAASQPALASGAPPPGSPPLYLSLLVLRN